MASTEFLSGSCAGADPGRPPRRGDAVERVFEFQGAAVEIRQYDLHNRPVDIERARPQAYVVELLLSVGRPHPPTQAGASSAPYGARQMERVSLIAPGRTIPPSLPRGRRRTLLCALDARWIEALLPPGTSAEALRTRAVVSLRQTRLERLLGDIYGETREAKPGQADMIEALVRILAIEIVRGLEQADRAKPCGVGGLAPWRMRAIEQRLGAGARPTLDELAERCGVSVRHLCRAFKAQTGDTVGAYIGRAMAGRARRLLEETDLTVAEIAHRLGFSTTSSFSHAFKRSTGLKPSQMLRPAQPRPQPTSD